LNKKPKGERFFSALLVGILMFIKEALKITPRNAGLNLFLKERVKGLGLNHLKLKESVIRKKIVSNSLEIHKRKSVHQNSN